MRNTDSKTSEVLKVTKKHKKQFGLTKLFFVKKEFPVLIEVITIFVPPILKDKHIRISQQCSRRCSHEFDSKNGENIASSAVKAAGNCRVGLQSWCYYDWRTHAYRTIKKSSANAL